MVHGRSEARIRPTGFEELGEQLHEIWERFYGTKDKIGQSRSDTARIGFLFVWIFVCQDMHPLRDKVGF